MFEEKEKKGRKFVRHIIYGTSNYPRPKPTRFIGRYFYPLIFRIGIDSQFVPLKVTLLQCILFDYLFLYVALLLSVQSNRRFFPIYQFWILDMDLFNMLRFIFVLIWGALEIFRLLNGYEGNIKEQFPEAFSFFLLTMMNMIFLVLILVFAKRFPFEFALIILQLIFYAFELILCCSVMRTVNQAKIILLSQRAPLNNNEYLIKKYLEKKKMENEMGIKNKKKDEPIQEEEENFIQQRDNQQYN